MLEKRTSSFVCSHLLDAVKGKQQQQRNKTHTWTPADLSGYLAELGSSRMGDGYEGKKKKTKPQWKILWNKSFASMKIEPKGESKTPFVPSNIIPVLYVSHTCALHSGFWPGSDMWKCVFSADSLLQRTKKRNGLTAVARRACCSIQSSFKEFSVVYFSSIFVLDQVFPFVWLGVFFCIGIRLGCSYLCLLWLAFARLLGSLWFFRNSKFTPYQRTVHVLTFINWGTV